MCIDETPHLGEITWISIHSLPFRHTMKRWDSNMFHWQLEIILKWMGACIVACYAKVAGGYTWSDISHVSGPTEKSNSSHMTKVSPCLGLNIDKDALHPIQITRKTTNTTLILHNVIFTRFQYILNNIYILNKLDHKDLFWPKDIINVCCRSWTHNFIGDNIGFQCYENIWWMKNFRNLIWKLQEEEEEEKNHKEQMTRQIK